MNGARSLQFLWTPVSLVASVVLVLATAGLGYVAWRRSGYRRLMGLLELLRLGLVGAVAVLLNQPEWVEWYRPEERPEVVVYWDASGSMETRDVVEAGSQEAITRKQAVAGLTTPSAWDVLAGRFDVTVEPFSAASSGHGTDLFTPLERVARERPNVRGVVVISDGDWNEGPPPVQAAVRLRGRGVPIFAVPVGSRDRLPDLEVLSLDVPTFGVMGKSVRVSFTLESSLPREVVTTVTLRSSDGDELTKEVRVAAMTRTSDALTWKPRGTGDTVLTLEVPRHPDEVLPDNNVLSAPIAIRDERLKVLVVESYPRWEYRYLRNALSRDPGVELSCLLFHPGLGRVGGGNQDYIKQFPEGLEELSRYDVVFLGDVGVEPGQLTEEQCRLLRGLVEYQASGLVFLPGWQGRQFSLLETPLGDLYPVVLDASQPGGLGIADAEPL